MHDMIDDDDDVVGEEEPTYIPTAAALCDSLVFREIHSEPIFEFVQRLLRYLSGFAPGPLVVVSLSINACRTDTVSVDFLKTALEGP